MSSVPKEDVNIVTSKVHTMDRAGSEVMGGRGGGGGG